MNKPRNRSRLSRKEKVRKTKRSKKHPKAVSIHHILPRSRGGGESLANKSKIVACDHERFHKLFVNMTPFEILAWLQIYFWGLDLDHVSEYCFNRGQFLFKNGKYKIPRKSKGKIQKVSLEFEEEPFIRYVFHVSDVTPYHSQVYYELFGSMAQYEVLAWLEMYFWNKQTYWIDKYVASKDYFLSNIKNT